MVLVLYAYRPNSLDLLLEFADTCCMATDSIELVPEKTEVVNPSRFEEYYRLYRENIESAHVIPPRLGSQSFGLIRIVWKYPALRRVPKKICQ